MATNTKPLILPRHPSIRGSFIGDYDGVENEKAFLCSRKQYEHLPRHNFPKPQVAPRLIIASSSTKYFENKHFERTKGGPSNKQDFPSVPPASQTSMFCVLVLRSKASFVQLRLLGRAAVHKIACW